MIIDHCHYVFRFKHSVDTADERRIISWFLANVNSRSRSLYAIAVRRLSYVCLERSCTLLSRLKFSAIFFLRLVPWPSVDTHGKWCQGNPSVGGFKPKRGSQRQRFFIFGMLFFSKLCKIGGKLVLITNRKSYMSFRLVPKSVTLNDLERRNGPYFALFLPNLVISEAYCVNVVDKAITMDNLRLLCLVVNVRRGTARRPRYKFLADS